MLAATGGSLAPTGISHPFMKISTAGVRDPVPKGRRTSLIFSGVTIIKDDYDF